MFVLLQYVLSLTCACRSRVLPVEPCMRGVMWVRSAKGGHRVGLVLKGNKVPVSLQQHQDGVMVYLQQIPLLFLFSPQCHEY